MTPTCARTTPPSLRPSSLRTARHVQQRAYDLGVKKAPGAKTAHTGQWTHPHDLLQLVYADMGNEELARLLDILIQDI